jgi:metal-dependent amidase/aminoacylase/carboxypeptidase family protein
VAANDAVVLTVGALQAFTKANVIPHEALLELNVRETKPSSASEDFGTFGAEWYVPSVYWFVGGTDPDQYAEAKAADQPQPALRAGPAPYPETGVESLVVAGGAWLT